MSVWGYGLVRFRFFDVSIKLQLIITVSLIIATLVVSNILPSSFARRSIERRTMQAASTFMDQTRDSVLGILNDISRISYSLVFNPEVQDFLQAEDAIRRYELSLVIQKTFVNVKILNESIQGIRLYDTEGRCRYSFGDAVESIDETVRAQPAGRLVYTGLYHNAGQLASIVSYYYLMLSPVFSTSVGKGNALLGTCVLVVGCDNFQRIVQTAMLTPHSRFLLVDRNGVIMASETRQSVGTAFTGFERIANHVQDRLAIVQSIEVPETGWKIVSIVPRDELYADLTRFGRVNAATLAITFAFLGLCIIGFYLGIARPMGEVFAFMKSISRLGISSRFPTVYRNEIGIGVRNLNTMLDDIEKLTRDVNETQRQMYQLELSRKQLEISILQSQINPHFLCNTLECIRGIAMFYKAREIVDLSTAISRIFHYGMERADFVTIREELACLSDFMKIISIRFNGKIAMRLNVDPGVLECRTLKLVLQPIVENAVLHGLERKIGGGTIDVCISHEGREGLLCQVGDNGVGIGEERLRFVRECMEASRRPGDGRGVEIVGLGIQNTCRRLWATYGERARMTIESRPNEMTVVRMAFPLET